MESNPKEMLLQNEEEIDRISELPDPILSIILCNLPTKNAVGTSILSTRWKNLFLSVLPLKLDLDDSLFLNPNNSNNTPPVTFINFVDKLFNVTLSDVNSVEEIILHCYNQDYSVKEVASWIRAAVRLNVRRLDLKLKFYLRFDESTKALFRSLRGCTTLVTLRLWLDDECCFPYNFTLPNLKTLYLAELDFDEKELSRFIACCPALEYLHLFGFKYWYDVYIECPLLKKLVIEGCGEESVTDLAVDTPNLEVFMYNGSPAGRYFGRDLKSLHTAHIDVRPSQHQFNWLEEQGYDDNLVDLVNCTTMIVSSCSSTIHLRLSGCTIDALHSSSVLLPVFHNLMWLSLGCLNWSILARLLQIAPKLEQLTIEEGFQKNEDGFANFKNLLPISPECFVFHVKRIEFRVFEGQEDEIKIVEYFLKNGEVLQNLILHCLPSTDMSILTRLLVLPRQSKTCQIEYQMK